jgi:nitrite reductase (NADH) small subunit
MLIRIASVFELPPEGEAREFAVGDKMFCVANIDGVYRALDNMCPHRGGALGQGVVDGRLIVCPWHGWQVDTETGCAVQNRDLGVTVYEVKIEGDEVFISDDQAG